MSEETLVNRVLSRNSAVPGRSVNSARTHHFVIDEPAHAGGPGEEITPAEAFLSGVSACGVLLVEGYARDEGVPLRAVEATIEGVRMRSDTSRFAAIRLRFRLDGPDQAQAEALVGRYQEN